MPTITLEAVSEAKLTTQIAIQTELWKVVGKS